MECDYNTCRYYIRNGGLCCSPQDPDEIAGTIPRGYKLCKYNRLHGCGKQGIWYKEKEN